VGFGVVGVAFAVGLVQLLLPQGGSSVTAVSTQASSRVFTAVTPARLSGSGTKVTSSVPGTRRHPATTVGGATEPPTTAANRSVVTVKLMRSHRAAVPVGDGRHAVTTAGSLSPAQKVEVQMSDGTSAAATVTKVDTEANVAVLELAQPMEGTAPAIATREPAEGDAVTIGGAGDSSGVLRDMGNGFVVEGAQTADEGAPVMDPDGALVGLASLGDDGLVHLVPLADLTGLDAEALILTVWVGVRFEGDSLVVKEVQSGAPADQVGIEPGDTLLALDDTPLTTLDDIWRALAPHQPNDAVVLVVQRGDTQIAFDITLGVRPS
jgi:S1-C subfamily serine protease